MAQWTPSLYDPCLAALTNTLRILRAAAGSWARRGKESVPLDRVLAVLVFALRNPYHSDDLPLTLSACLGRVGAVAELFTFISNSAGKLRKSEAMAEAFQLLKMAAEEWSSGDPEKPPTAVVLHEVATVLFKHGLITRPPPPQIDE